MNTTFILNRLHATLARYGAAGTLTTRDQATRAPGGIVTLNSTVYNLSYVEDSFTYSETAAGLVKLGDRKVLIDAQQISDITTDDIFTTSDGAVFDVYKVDKTNVQGVGIAFVLYLRGAQA